jgi:hypothetical protein
VADFIQNFLRSARAAATRALPFALVAKYALRAAFWLGLTVCLLPTSTTHHVMSLNSIATCLQGSATARHGAVPSHGTLTSSDLAVPWQGRPLRALCKQQLAKNVRD